MAIQKIEDQLKSKQIGKFGKITKSGLDEEKMKIEDAKILENPGLEFRNKLNEISERMTVYKKRLINEFTDRIILLIIKGAYNKVEKRIFMPNKPKTMAFIFKINEHFFSKTMWDEIRELWNKNTYEAEVLKEELKNSINLKLKLSDIQIFDVILEYNEINVSLYYETNADDKKENDNDDEDEMEDDEVNEIYGVNICKKISEKFCIDEAVVKNNIRTISDILISSINEVKKNCTLENGEIKDNLIVVPDLCAFSVKRITKDDKCCIGITTSISKHIIDTIQFDNILHN